MSSQRGEGEQWKEKAMVTSAWVAQLVHAMLPLLSKWKEALSLGLCADKNCLTFFSTQKILVLCHFFSSRLEINPASPNELKEKPPVNKLGFGQVMTDHMLTCSWNSKDGWGAPVIERVQPLQLHPAAKVLHYGQELFEGMKAYRGKDDRIRMFRPMHNMARMNVTARRACLPTFDGHELLECIRKLVLLDQEWVPHSESASLYVRPTMIGTEPTLRVADSNEVLLFVLTGPAGPYYATGEMKPVRKQKAERFFRATYKLRIRLYLFLIFMCIGDPSG